MKTLELTPKNKYLIVTLDRGKSNPINHEMVTELRKVIKDCQEDNKIGGVILNGKPKFFSAGLDVIELYSYDKDKMQSFWKDFESLVFELTMFSKPLISSITGHSPAGGCVLAICCDYRIMAEGNFQIGLNEHQIGIVVPDSIFELYAFWLGRGKAYQYLLESKLLTPNDALEVGLVNEVVSPEDVLKKAEDKIASYLQLEQTAWKKSKLNLRSSFKSSHNKDSMDIVLKQWWSPQGRAALKMIVNMLESRKK